MVKHQRFQKLLREHVGKMGGGLNRNPKVLR